jgi:hypothetical protein
MQRTRRFLRTAVSATGIVVENVSRDAGDSTRQGRSLAWYPRVRFQTASGREVELLSNTGSRPPAYSVDQQVTVLYNPSHPSTAYIESFGSLWTGTILLAVLRDRGHHENVAGAQGGEVCLVARQHAMDEGGAAAEVRQDENGLLHALPPVAWEEHLIQDETRPAEQRQRAPDRIEQEEKIFLLRVSGPCVRAGRWNDRRAKRQNRWKLKVMRRKPQPPCHGLNGPISHLLRLPPQ